MKLLHQKKNQPELFLRRTTLDFVPHLHNALELVLLREGHSTVLCAGRLFSLSPGDLFFAFPNQIHAYEHSQNCHAVVLIVPTSPYLSAYRDTLEQLVPADPVLRRGQWENSGALTLLEMALDEPVGPASPIMQGYILLIVGKLLPLLPLVPTPSDYSNALQPLLLYLNDHYTEPLSRKEIADAVGYNESYISHLFSDALHTTLTDYLTSLRLEDAAHLLANTSLSVSQIAVSLGFGSIRSFNRVFLKRMHLSPSAYRAASRAPAAHPL